MPIFPVADAHCDFLYYAAKEGADISRTSARYCLSTERLKEGGVALQFFAAWTDEDESRRTPLQQFTEMATAYRDMLTKNADVLVPFTHGFDPQSGKVATVLTIEDSVCIDGDIDNINRFYDMGVRAATLTWNYKNSLAASSACRIDTGLTPLGRRAVRRMADTGMAIDLAHLGDRGIEQVFGLTDTPVFSSHTNARDLFYARRSMKNAHIREVARRGGVIGVNFYVKQLTNKPQTCISDIADQICYIADKIGIECVCIGSDFDGMNVYPTDIEHSGHFPRLTDELLRRGMTESEVYAVMYGNLSRYISGFVG